MQITQHISNINFDTIPVDKFWNMGVEKESKMHRIHAYPAKFPAFITTKALEYVAKKGANVKKIADIFCGCGTTAYEASRNGIDYWGCDINPVATLIAEVKSKSYATDKLNKYFSRIIDNFNKARISASDIEGISDRIKYWYSVDQISGLLRLKNTIKEVIPAKSKYQKFFLCAFSNILKPTSVWLTKSIKPQVDPNKNPIDVIQAFRIQFEFMKKASEESNWLTGSNVEIENANILKRKITKSFVDLIITSPPYVTSYEYADLHQLSTLWLEFTEDYKSFREGTIGSLYHDSNFKEDIKQLNSTGEKIVFQLYNQDKRKAKSAAKYYVDMQRCIKKSYNMLNDNGFAFFVIGNTEYKTVHIDNAKHLVESMITYGFTDIEVTKREISGKILTPYRDEKGMFTTDKNSRKVYSEEFIVIGKKTCNG
jgi:DNA modification methylase